MGLAKKGLSAYEQSQSNSGSGGRDDRDDRDDGDSSNNYGKTGGRQHNNPPQRGGGGRDDGDDGDNSNDYGKSRGQYNTPPQRSGGGRDDGDGGDDSYNKTGGREFNAPHHGGSGENQSFYNEQDVVNKAASHSSEDPSMFSSALSHISSNSHQHNQPIDEEEVTDAHRKIYQQGGSADGLSASSMGSAAALQAFKKFTGGGGGGPSSQSDLISLAMSEASKLFDQSGGSSQGNKQDAVNSAGMTIMKLMVQSKLGGSGGGIGGLMGMASKFM